MEEEHTLETLINFVCHLNYFTVSLHISRFILCIGIIIILFIDSCYLHGLDFIYLCVRTVILVFLLFFCIHAYKYVHICYFFEILLCVFNH
jgi:hypothetical protein